MITSDSGTNGSSFDTSAWLSLLLECRKRSIQVSKLKQKQHIQLKVS